MSVKIFHTGDLHIGMKFGGYPDGVREDLQEARISSLKNMVRMADEENCDIFAIAGDLFDRIKIRERDIKSTREVLNSFKGSCVLLLPGNHDHEDGMVSIWNSFRNDLIGNTIFLNEYKPYPLKKYGIDVVVYPAPCQKKHSDSNNLNWIKEIEKRPEAKWHIGMAHGALKGFSPDLQDEYFPMTVDELETIGLDIWLLGHTHVFYPRETKTTSHNIFYSGTPEPDGMDCKHEGSAWIITMGEPKKIVAERVSVGQYRFMDEEREVEEESCFSKLKEEFCHDKAGKVLLRLKLTGMLDRELYEEKEIFYREIRKYQKYFVVDDSELGIKISKQFIDNEFIEGSLPHKLMMKLIEEEGEDVAQLAYEFIKEVKET